ncbi:hypothetical protein R0135_09065 [Congregibacter variabilis]|uniref:DoxX protein n=1 Tax=Congregibacter variabilis TaxID=3081200 RepID=A0ABZ0HYL6_9GAMM|nr:hypothetical protein R0135_09065 [Congregibacter sp. IMCC43200]
MRASQTEDMRVAIALFSLRISIFVVFLVWTLDKLTNYQHSSGVILHYYHLEVSRWFLIVLGLLELALLLAFLFGLWKTASYGLVLLAHLASTIASFWRLFPPYELHQLLYFGSLPLLAACFALFLLRDRDCMMNIAVPRHT